MAIYKQFFMSKHGKEKERLLTSFNHFLVFHSFLMEERSTDSSMNKVLSPSSCSSHEESGWTTYFDDLLPEENGESSACSDGYEDSSSLVSDAASCAAWQFNRRVQCSAPMVPARDERFTKLSFKKKRGVLDDDSLEDTASSPVSSPKVSELQQKGMKLSRTDCDRSNRRVEVGSSNCSELQEVDRNKSDFSGSNGYPQLKKRGLCLVPLSMIVNILQ